MDKLNTYFASVVSDLQQSDICLSFKARMFESPKANLNGVRVTEGFIDEIVSNAEKYICMPIYGDIHNLANCNYKNLGHLYDATTGEFRSTQIGAWYKFEKETFENGCSLIGYGRIPKRNKAVCNAFCEMFASGDLKFSFEIACGEYKKLDDGTIEIDVSENNHLEGEAVVTFPACESAVALDLVAELNQSLDESTEVIEMHDVITTETDIMQDSGLTVVTDDVSIVAESDNNASEPDCKDCSVSNVVSEVSDQSAEENVEQQTAENETPVAENAEGCGAPGCTEDHPCDECKQEETENEENAACKKQKAESEIDVEAAFESMKAEIESLKKMIAQLTEAKKEIAEVEEKKEETPAINPFVSEIHVDDAFGLLKPVESTDDFSLLKTW